MSGDVISPWLTPACVYMLAVVPSVPDTTKLLPWYKRSRNVTSSSGRPYARRRDHITRCDTLPNALEVSTNNANILRPLRLASWNWRLSLWSWRMVLRAFLPPSCSDSKMPVSSAMRVSLLFTTIEKILYTVLRRATGRWLVRRSGGAFFVMSVTTHSFHQAGKVPSVRALSTSVWMRTRMGMGRSRSSSFGTPSGPGARRSGRVRIMYMKSSKSKEC
mmetsp:Transcript_50982/g.103675  ORF Transcript_50982/g.103675 Transcript_50982/m.103675 type:complete len:218 (+) Transcript_50982:202-855(+)